MVAGQLFTVSQVGATCNFAILTRQPGLQFWGGHRDRHLTTISGCSWTVNNTNTWINITSVTNATNSGIISYTVIANPTALLRTGRGLHCHPGRSPSARRERPCAFVIFPTNRIHSSGAETGTVSVTSLIGCNWTVRNTNSWITITSGTHGTGSKTPSLTAWFLIQTPTRASGL